MTLLGKVFTLTILVLSVIFFSVAVAVNSTHINQKKEAERQKTLADNATREKEQLQGLLESLKRELAIEQMARRTALAALQTQVSALDTELSAKEKELRDLQTAHTTLTAAEKSTTEQLAARSRENEQLREQIKNTRDSRNQLVQKLVAAKDEYNRLQGSFQTLQERAVQLRLENNLVTQKLQVLGFKPDTLLDAPPEVKGEVLDVASNGLVVVSLGRDDGIREGFTLEVHRSGQYLGRVKVKTVRDDKAVAEVLTGYQKGYIRAGDSVNSKLF
ncbi:MAG: hypothetical protein KF752_02785 [Pirellulaceae bacterium]|nr:hypothetical protein [Pirellulaceae bacterium]